MINEDINFYFSLYRFTIKFEDQLKLLTYPGNILRGAIGSVLKETCCINKKTKECDECIVKPNCVYVYLFESYPKEILPNFGATKDLPRPFVLEVDHTKNLYQPQEEFEFNLILFGKATQYIPYFILTFENLSKKGIGTKNNRTKFQLTEVKNFFDEVVYSQDRILRNLNSHVTLKQLLDKFDTKTYRNEITLNFLSPTRIKEQGLILKEPQFISLFRAVYRRLLAILYFYCDQEIKFDYKMLTKKAKNVKIKNNNLTWSKWFRYSKRRKIVMELSGFIGKITYQTEESLEDFLPFLILGQYTHIGKNCTFGLGRYEIVL
ncbi:MAG: CRISPR system precrRNA processing endoribonuclease RAMP protein Cas6 [Endomicrobiia bacterium]